MERAMDSYKMENSPVIRNTEEEEKVIKLFEFIMELNKLRNRSVLKISEQPWSLMFSDIPDDPENIKLYYRDRIDKEDEKEADDDSTDDGKLSQAESPNDVLLSVHKPELSECPEPDQSFAAYLLPGWEDFRNEAEISDYIENDGNISYFIEDANNGMLYNSWNLLREKWRAERKIQESTKQLFDTLFNLHLELIRDPETDEIIVANGILCDRENQINHPILTRRAVTDFNADENTIYIKDTTAQSELYNAVLQQIKDVKLEMAAGLGRELQEDDYHPLDRSEKGTPAFLRRLLNQLSANSLFSMDGIPLNWQKQNSLLLYWEPCFIVRKRLDITMETIKLIIENIRKTGKIPNPIRQLVSGGFSEPADDTGPETVEEQLAAVGGESRDVCLSKEANKEQLEIAKRIDSSDAVLVQGPPGTGKTHTIANLMGHFFAQGKSVLVTSYTNKALSVLKDKIDPALRSLCVSLVEESNRDMERSVEGIVSYMSDKTSSSLNDEMDTVRLQRDKIIEKLADVRRKIFNVIKRECTDIGLNGEEISPSEAAKFVSGNVDLLQIIPGKVNSDTIPLTLDELAALYRSNSEISKEDESELAMELPDPETLVTPAGFSNALKEVESARELCNSIKSLNDWEIVNKPENGSFLMSGVEIRYPDEDEIDGLKNSARSAGDLSGWMKAAALAGKNGELSRGNWKELVSLIDQACSFAAKVNAEQLGVKIRFSDEVTHQHIKNINDLKEKLQLNGKIGWLENKFNKYGPAFAIVTVDGHPLSTAKECQYVLDQIELKELRRRCALFWDELLVKYDGTVPEFYSLDQDNPESVAKKFISKIEKCLDWYQKECEPLRDKLRSAGFPLELIFATSDLDSGLVEIGKTVDAANNIVPQLCDICSNMLKLQKSQSALEALIGSLKTSGCRAVIYAALVKAAEDKDPEAYSAAFDTLKKVYEKSDLLKRRREMLDRLKTSAPGWASAIAARKEIHGLPDVPENIDKIWKCKRLAAIIENIISHSFKELQNEAACLSREYRKKTAEYAEKSAWYHLLKRTESDIDLRQALMGWKETVTHIGKGKGKRAPRYRVEARRLMAKCQTAVPGWIMPVNKALETLDPRTNRFDVVIIDEASQADISSLAILYMGSKLIIVGDDKQVTPVGIGIETEKIEYLEKKYIKGRIPNSHLYNEKTSIYDLAATTFRPLMLREHFRCVPDIIGFSNRMSYNGKIKPLRESGSSTLFPAVVNYRVENGKRAEGCKININEAEAVVALMQACINQPEYAGKTFGVISLLGEEQAKKIQSMIAERIDLKDIQNRRILCGNSANFQGDERDVVFLSLVDSGSGEGPVRLQGEGADNTALKRYNVAASRAKEQLWVVDSFDPARDLKQGDLRKSLIDWSLNPKVFSRQDENIDTEEESPFGSEVAGVLSERGFRIVRQWKAGSYTLDIVAVCGEKKAAIECDGERADSSESKIRADMERQTILERLGWNFIRIRGSEYYRFPEKTIDALVSDLKKCGIFPESNSEVQDNSSVTDTELLERVIRQASEILEEKDNKTD